jgi:hypothetical protein
MRLYKVFIFAYLRRWLHLIWILKIPGLVSTDDPDLLFKDAVAIGHGATADVYKVSFFRFLTIIFKATNVSTSESVAIKKFKLSGSKMHEEDWRDVEKEIKLVKGCSHEHILAYFGSYFKNDTVWMVLGFCVGSCFDILGVFKEPFAEDEIRSVCVQTLMVCQLSLSKTFFVRCFFFCTFSMLGIRISPQCQESSPRHKECQYFAHRRCQGFDVYWIGFLFQVKLADFGASTDLSAEGSANSLIGTPYWFKHRLPLYQLLSSLLWLFFKLTQQDGTRSNFGHGEWTILLPSRHLVAWHHVDRLFLLFTLVRQQVFQSTHFTCTPILTPELAETKPPMFTMHAMSVLYQIPNRDPPTLRAPTWLASILFIVPTLHRSLFSISLSSLFLSLFLLILGLLTLSTSLHTACSTTPLSAGPQHSSSRFSRPSFPLSLHPTAYTHPLGPPLPSCSSLPRSHFSPSIITSSNAHVLRHHSRLLSSIHPP